MTKAMAFGAFVTNDLPVQHIVSISNSFLLSHIDCYEIMFRVIKDTFDGLFCHESSPKCNLIVDLLHKFIFDLVNKTIYAHLHFTFFRNV